MVPRMPVFVRRCLLLTLTLVLTGCEEQPHHHEVSPALLAAVTAGVETTIAQAKLDSDRLPPPRRLTTGIRLLSMHAQNAGIILPGFTAELIDEARLRAQANAARDALAERGMPLQAEHLLNLLLATPGPLDRDRLIVLIASDRQLRVEHRLAVPEPLPAPAE